MVTVVHGIFRCNIPFHGQTVEVLRLAAKAQLFISDKDQAFVNGKLARTNHVLRKGDSVEFTLSDDEQTS
jgi:hypothetical protein